MNDNINQTMGLNQNSVNFYLFVNTYYFINFYFKNSMENDFAITIMDFIFKKNQLIIKIEAKIFIASIVYFCRIIVIIQEQEINFTNFFALKAQCLNLNL